MRNTTFVVLGSTILKYIINTLVFLIGHFLSVLAKHVPSEQGDCFF